MPPKPLSKRSLIGLIQLFEQSSQSITDIDGRSLHGFPAWDTKDVENFTKQDLATWTQCIGYAGCYPVPCGDDRVLADLEEDDDPDQYRYCCPETFCTKYVSAERVAIHAVTVTKFLDYLSDLLKILPSHRRGSNEIEDVLWQLGKMRVADAQIEVWLVRGLRLHIDPVFEYFQKAVLPDSGLILTTGRALPGYIPPPRSYRVVPIVDVLVDYGAAPVIDVDRIHRVLLAKHGTGFTKTLPVLFDPYTKTLTISTKSLEPWVVTGKRQIAVVQYLFDQYSNGRRWIPAREIFIAVYGSSKSGRSQNIQSIFRGNPYWEDYIITVVKGMYGFNLD